MLTKYFVKIDSLYYLKNNNLLLLKNKAGYYSFFCPNYLFYKKINENAFKLLFKNKFTFISFIKHFIFSLSNINRIFFIKFKLRGLGYKLRKICNNLYRFYFTRTNYIYVHRPKNILIKSRKKRIILLSNNSNIIHSFFKHLLLLHPIGPYNRKGFHFPKKILILKKGKKIA